MRLLFLSVSSLLVHFYLCYSHTSSIKALFHSKMESVGEPLRHHKSRFRFPFAGIVLSIAGVVLLAPVLTIPQNCPDKFFIFIPIIYASLLLLVTLNFYLNMLSLLLHVMAHVGAPEAPSPVFLLRYLPPAARAVTLTTLLLMTPLSIHVATAKESMGMAIEAALMCLALVTMLCSAFKKLFVSRGFAPPLFALCISTGFIVVFDLITFITHHISIQFLLMFVSCLVFFLGIALLLLRSGTPADGHLAEIQAENLVISFLSVSIAILLLGGYIMIYMALIDMGAGDAGAVEM